MTAVRRGLDLLVDLVGVAAWGFAAFVIGSRFISPTAGGLLGLGLALSALAWALGTHLQESRMSRLSAGLCPRCRDKITTEHRHRRWEPSRSEWLQPVTSWECRACGYAHNESWACPTCPAAL
ncbi:MAG TPA: hypothetical protein VJB57_16655 [Dehalococcoidia bacterium]|nr:hypothetical protein [Dehalococcoidia bacterium]